MPTNYFIMELRWRLFGDINSSSYIYRDSWAWKDTAAANVGNWVYGGNDCSDNSSSTQTSGCPFPLATTSCPSSSTVVNTPLEGTWKLADIAGALQVGPDSASSSWWSSGANVPTDRNCLFDDSISFDANGNFMHYMDGSTWLESWQAGSPSEGCGTPIAPHNGGSHTYTYVNGVLTVSGPGAHVGLAKVHNGGEDGAPVNNQISYSVTFSGANSEMMTVDISFPNAGGTNGLGWWRFIYTKTNLPPPPPPPSYTVTFNVHTDLIAGNVSADGIYIGGGFVGGHDALLLGDSDGDGVWSGSTTLDAAGGHFTILNGNCSDWSCKEDISGQPCADAGNYNDRNTLLGGFNQDTTVNLQYGSCTAPQPQTSSSLTLTGIMDFSLSGSSGKALMLTANQSISDLSAYGIGCANNGGGTDGQEYTFPAVGVSSGQHIILCRDSAALSTYFDGCLEQFDGAIHPTLIITGSNSLAEMETMPTNYFIMELRWRLLETSIVVHTFIGTHGHGKIQPLLMLGIGFMEEMIVLITLLQLRLQVVHFL